MTTPNIIGCPTQVTITTPSVTCTGSRLLAGNLTGDKGLKGTLGGSSRIHQYFTGADTRGFTFTTDDADVIAALPQGTIVATAAIAFQGAYLGSGTQTGTAAGSRSITKGIVKNAYSLEFNPDGTPAKQKIDIEVAIADDGTAGAVTDDLNLAA